MMSPMRHAAAETAPRLLIALAAAAAFIAFTGVPASVWFEPRFVMVANQVEGLAPKMTVSREIKRTFNGTWRVELERREGSGYVLIDAAEGGGRYATDNKLPADLDMDWWTYPKVMRPGPGWYRLDTCWTVEIPVVQDKTVCMTSPPFEIKARPA